MIKSNFLKNLAAQLSDALPSQLAALKGDFEKNCQMVLTKAFNKLDLVTREEFDVQTKVLLRTRKKLEALEAELHLMEKKLNAKSHKK